MAAVNLVIQASEPPPRPDRVKIVNHWEKGENPSDNVIMGAERKKLLFNLAKKQFEWRQR